MTSSCKTDFQNSFFEAGESSGQRCKDMKEMLQRCFKDVSKMFQRYNIYNIYKLDFGLQ